LRHPSKYLLILSIVLISASLLIIQKSDNPPEMTIITKNILVKTQSSSVNESITLTKMTTKTVIIGGNYYPEWSIYFTGAKINGNDQIIGVVSYVYSDNNYVYVFFPQGTTLWGLKFDHNGNIIWSFKYDFGKIGLSTAIYHMNGIVDNGVISLVMEDKKGYDYNIEVDMNTGAIIQSRVIKDSVFDIFTLNYDKYYRQVYSRIFYHNFNDYKIITGAYEYIIPMVSQGKYIVITKESKFTNGGYDYMIYIMNAISGKIDRSYFFGSTVNDFFYGVNDKFTTIGRPFPGFLVDNRYAYVFISDGTLNDYNYNFGIIKIDRLTGNIVWVMKYKLPKVDNYNKIEFQKIYDDGSYINIFIRLTSVSSPYKGSLIILKVNKVDGSVPDVRDDLHRHGAILITDNMDQGNVIGAYIDNNNNLYIVSMFRYQNTRIIRFTQVAQGTSDLYKISVEPIKVSSGAGDPDMLVYYRIFT